MIGNPLDLLQLAGGSDVCPTKAGIYMILCSVSGKAYIGQSIHMRRRVRHHILMLRSSTHHNNHLQHAHDLYGPESISGHYIENCDEKDLSKREAYYIGLLPKELRYNLAEVDQTRPTFRHSAESRAKMSAKMKGRPPHPPEVRKRIAEKNRGRKQSPEEILKRSLAHKGKKHTDTARLNMSKAQKGKTVSPETRKKISEVQIGKKVSEETKKKHRQYRPTEEIKRKISKGLQGRPVSEETRRKIAAQAGWKHTEETKRKMREAKQRYLAKVKANGSKSA